MADEFYDPYVQTAGALAEQFKLSVSDVLALLLQAGKDEGMVRKLLAEGMKSEEAMKAKHEGRIFDVVGYVQEELRQRKSRLLG